MQGKVAKRACVHFKPPNFVISYISNRNLFIKINIPVMFPLGPINRVLNCINEESRIKYKFIIRIAIESHNSLASI